LRSGTRSHPAQFGNLLLYLTFLRLKTFNSCIYDLIRKFCHSSVLPTSHDGTEMIWRMNTALYDVRIHLLELREIANECAFESTESAIAPPRCAAPPRYEGGKPVAFAWRTAAGRQKNRSNCLSCGGQVRKGERG
jgi:hypothetical protein